MKQKKVLCCRSAYVSTKGEKKKLDLNLTKRFLHRALRFVMGQNW